MDKVLLMNENLRLKEDFIHSLVEGKKYVKSAMNSSDFIFNLISEKFDTVILNGSQVSQFLNDFVVKYNRIATCPVNIIRLKGKNIKQEVQEVVDLLKK